MIAGATAALAVLSAAGGWALGRRWVDASRTLGRLDRPRRAEPTILRAPSPVRAALTRSAVPGDHDTLWRLWCAGLVVCLASIPVIDGAPVVVAATVLGPASALVATRDRSERRRSRQLPDALEAVAAGLRGGSSLRSAIADAASMGGPLGAELAGLAHRAASGSPLPTVLATWADRADDAHSRLAAAAITVAAEVGGPGARALDSAAAGLRDRQFADAEAAALATQARLSALLLTVAPIGFAFVLTSLDPASARFLFTTPPGWACLVTGLGLDAAGAWWMSRLVRSAR